MDPDPAPATGGLPRIRLSSVLLLAIGAIASIVLAAIYGFIFFYITPTTAQLWWAGLMSMIFAVVFYVLYAATREKRIVRPLTAAFFLIGAGSFYGSIFTNAGEPVILVVIWIVLLSILVVGALAAIFLMARDAEAEAARKARRKVIP